MQVTISIKLAMFGDNGEVDFYRINPSPQNDHFTSAFCPLTYDMSMGLINFRRLVCSAYDILIQADIVAIAGDVIYAETKIAKARATIRANDTYNMGKVVLANNTFPDAVNWNLRLSCGWKGVRAVLENYVSWCGKPLPAVFQKSSNGNFMALQLIEGNHSFDVDINIESNEMLNLGNTFYLPVNETLTLDKCNYDISYSQSAHVITLPEMMLYPRISQIVKDGVKVQFLDVNTFIFICGFQQNETAYNACTNGNNFNVLYAAIHTFKQANLYCYRYLNALKNLDQNANWRISRGHHAIFTIGSSDFTDFLYVDFIYNGINYGKVIDAVRKANIHFHFASHLHLAYLLVFPYYNDVLKKANFTNDGLTENDDVPNGCYDASSYFLNSSLSTYSNSTSCMSGINMQISINAKNPEYFWQFVAGSSGRIFNDLSYDNLTIGNMVWGRSVSTNGSPNYGGFLMDFRNTSCYIQYFEIQANNGTLQNLNSTLDFQQFSLNFPYTFNLTLNNQFNNYPNINKYFMNKFNCTNITSNNCSTYISNYTPDIFPSCKTANSFYINLNFVFIIFIIIKLL